MTEQALTVAEQVDVYLSHAREHVRRWQAWALDRDPRRPMQVEAIDHMMGGDAGGERLLVFIGKDALGDIIECSLPVERMVRMYGPDRIGQVADGIHVFTDSCRQTFERVWLEDACLTEPDALTRLLKHAHRHVKAMPEGGLRSELLPHITQCVQLSMRRDDEAQEAARAACDAADGDDDDD